MVNVGDPLRYVGSCTSLMPQLLNITQHACLHVPACLLCHIRQPSTAGLRLLLSLREHLAPGLLPKARYSACPRVQFFAT